MVMARLLDKAGSTDPLTESINHAFTAAV